MMTYKKVPLKNGVVYLLSIPDMASDRPMSGTHLMMLDLSEQIEAQQAEIAKLSRVMIEKEVLNAERMQEL